MILILSLFARKHLRMILILSLFARKHLRMILDTLVYTAVLQLHVTCVQTYAFAPSSCNMLAGSHLLET